METFAQSGEGGEQHHRIWSKVVWLKVVELQERAEETARRQPQAAHEVRAEYDPLALLRRRRYLPRWRGTGLH